ncbi:hypothetical protein V1517DRAFT_340525 [Lipomyces orientalis]|uniref:Uncharacterized protein n=1 Tax=Lipomyces orientalis TaxID=1233043 RepID=A0ACC3THL3_9ASCO
MPEFRLRVVLSQLSPLFPDPAELYLLKVSPDNLLDPPNVRLPGNQPRGSRMMSFIDKFDGRRRRELPLLRSQAIGLGGDVLAGGKVVAIPPLLHWKAEWLEWIWRETSVQAKFLTERAFHPRLPENIVSAATRWLVIPWMAAKILSHHFDIEPGSSEWDLMQSHFDSHQEERVGPPMPMIVIGDIGVDLPAEVLHSAEYVDNDGWPRLS